jgi:hypothetical protein
MVVRCPTTIPWTCSILPTFPCPGTHSATTHRYSPVATHLGKFFPTKERSFSSFLYEYAYLSSIRLDIHEDARANVVTSTFELPTCTTIGSRSRARKKPPRNARKMVTPSGRAATAASRTHTHQGRYPNFFSLSSLG